MKLILCSKGIVMAAKKHPEYQYLNLLQEILDDGEWIVDQGTNVRLKSLFGRQCHYDLSLGFPLLTTKRVYWKGVLHELYWFMAGMTNIKYLVDNNVHIWDDYPYKIYTQKFGYTDLTKDEFIEKIASSDVFAKKWGDLPRIYGEMWRKWPTKRPGKTVDQLQWVIDELTTDPYAKNCIVNSWNPEYLYTMADREDTSYFPICHNMYQVSIKGGKLSLQLYQRSADSFLGVPFNIASYALLAIILAKILKVQPGEFIHTFGDVHIYENHIDQVKEELTREPKPLSTVTIDDSVVSLDTFTPDKVTLTGYDPHPTIKGDLTVAGGFYEKKK
jgi:thymidylate synthase